MLWDCAQHGQEHLLVRQHHGRLNTGMGVAAGKDFGELLCLGYAPGHAQQVELRIGEAFRVGLEGVREFLGESPEKHGRLVVGIPYGVRTEVPAELAHPGFVHLAEQHPLALVESIEAHEHETPDALVAGGEDVCGALPLKPVAKIPVHHSLVAQSFITQSLTEVAIERQQYPPDAEKALFHGSRGQEMARKALQGFPLRLGKVRPVVLHLLDVRHVGEQPTGIHQILVDIVEIPEEGVAPEDEIVKWLRLLVKLPVAGIQFQQELYPVRRGLRSGAGDEIVHREEPGAHYGATAGSDDLFPEIVLEEA